MGWEDVVTPVLHPWVRGSWVKVNLDGGHSAKTLLWTKTCGKKRRPDRLVQTRMNCFLTVEPTLGSRSPLLFRPSRLGQ